MNIHVDPFVFDIRSDFYSFQLFLRNTKVNIAYFCQNISFSESIKRLNPHSLEFGLKITKSGEGYDNNLYLFIVPSIIFEYKTYYKENQEKLYKEIQKAISTHKCKITPEVLQYMEIFCADEKWLKFFKSFLYRCLFYEKIEKQKNFKREVLIEASIEILPDLPPIKNIYVSLGTSEYEVMIEHLTIIFSDTIGNLIQEFLLTVKNIECIVISESDHFYLTNTFDKMLEMVNVHFPKIKVEKDVESLKMNEIAFELKKIKKLFFLLFFLLYYKRF